MARTNAPAFSLQVGPHAASSLVVTRFSGTESLSRLYDFHVEFFEKDGQLLELAELPGTQALLTVQIDEAPVRHVHGLVRQTELLGRIGGRWRYRVQVVPKLERLCQMRKSRIFQEQAVPDIVKKVLGEAGVEHRFTLSGSYAPREYCVQYRESDFDFISRLLESEGIFYFFEHAEGSHTLVLGDGENAHKDLPGEAKLPLREADQRTYDEEFISRMERVHRLRPGAVMLRDYDFEKPALDLSTTGKSADGVAALELYDYPGEYVAPGVGTALAKVRMEAKAQGAQTHLGQSVCPRLSPGYLFEADHPGDGTFSGQYLVEEVMHSGQQPDTHGGAESLGGMYHNDFQCLPKGVPFRPPRLTPQPHIPGLQTATVTGPGGEEIHTDQHGRIKVQFHWDREGKRDDRSSCYVRVGQSWGGLAWGALFLPRIGQEVLVRFLEGNPDRPLIAGAVYNGENPTPYGLPGDRTKSTVKSASSLGSNGFNEARIEDKAGQEEIFAHAQKDEDLLTENDKDQEVRGYEDLLVKKDRKRTVEGNQQLEVSLDDASLVEGNQTLHVKGNRTTTTHGSHSESVEGNQSITVARNVTTTLFQTASETVGAAKALTIGAGYSINVALAHTESTGGTKAIQVGGMWLTSTEGSRQESIAADSSMRVGGNCWEEVEGTASITTNKDISINVGT
ncbi:MAG: type VI secretion system Vgr family protein, partial [Hyalangium sp.]|uniref:type VI secretion system Vgr family protein n=1 Tax=Hyalangium sp. TaxID=2028555 RepID=UPI00389A122F